MSDAPPTIIKITNPRTGLLECARLHSEHQPYWVYMFLSDLSTVLVLESEISKYYASADQCPESAS